MRAFRRDDRAATLPVSPAVFAKQQKNRRRTSVLLRVVMVTALLIGTAAITWDDHWLSRMLSLGIILGPLTVWFAMEWHLSRAGLVEKPQQAWLIMVNGDTLRLQEGPLVTELGLDELSGARWIVDRHFNGLRGWEKQVAVMQLARGESIVVPGSVEGAELLLEHLQHHGLRVSHEDYA